MENREIARQIFHVLVGIAIVFFVSFNLINARILFYILIFGCFLSLLSLKFKIPIVNFFLKNLERPEAKFPGKGLIFYVAGSLLVLKLFSLNIALASIIILAFGDSVSHLIGENFGRINLNNKSLKKIEGSIAGVLVGTVAALIFVPFFYSFLASLAAMFLELLEVKIGEEIIDDNLLVPLVAGTVMFLLSGI